MRPKMRSLLFAHAPPLLIAIAALTIWALGDPVSDLLLYQREAILEGEIWRLITGHWVHVGWQHLGMNLTGLALIWYLFGDALRPPACLGLMATIALGQSLSLLAFHSDVLWYAGLSGLLHGLLAAGALLALNRMPLIATLTMMALALKLGVEMFRGASTDMVAWLGTPILIESHVYGTAWGIGAICFSRLQNGLSK